MTAHAKYSPSFADGWMVCTASLLLIDQMFLNGDLDDGEDEEEYSAEGTTAHMVRELSLSLGVDPFDFVGASFAVDGFTFTVDDYMADNLSEGIDWIREQTLAPEVENRVDLGPRLPGQFGTCDSGWVSGTTLYVSDLKYGMGVGVSADENRQLRLYAIGMWRYFGRPHIEKVVLNIDQPRYGGMKFWELPFSDLIAFGDRAAETYNLIEAGYGKFVPGEKQCKWCPVARSKRGCAARDQWLLGMFGGAFEDLSAETPVFPDDISPERRYFIVKHAAQAKKWLADLHEKSLDAAMDGEPDPGSKVVMGQRGDRYFTNEAIAESLLEIGLGDDAFKPRKIIGFTEIDKIVKPGRKRPGIPGIWDALQELTDQKTGKPILVSEDDPRPAVSEYADQFDDL